MTVEELFLYVQEHEIPKTAHVRVNVDRRAPVVPWSYGLRVQESNDYALILGTAPDFVVAPTAGAA